MKQLLSITIIGTSLVFGNAYGMDVSQYAHTTHLLVHLQEDRVTFNNEPAWFKQKSFEEKRQILLSAFRGLQFEGPDGDQRLTVNCEQIPFLQNSQATSTPSLLQRVANPTTLGFGALCVVGTWLATKKLAASE